MADWNDPRTTQSGFGESTRLNGEIIGSRPTIDEGLRKHMLAVYNYMASGVLLTGIVAMLVVQMGLVQTVLSGGLGIVVMLSPLAIVLAMSFGANKFSAGTLQIMFWAYATLMGLSLSFIFLVYAGSTIALAFFSAAAAFAGTSLYGYTTKKDISGWGSFLIIGVIGLIVASLVNFFFQSDSLSLALSYLTVLIFAGLTAWKTQMLKMEYYHFRGTEWANKSIILGALSLYISFINMFLALLRIFGSRE
jgi:FtsH-binding integral membrane protein